MCGWGLAPVATRQLVLGLPPLAVAAIRFTLSSLLFLPVALPALRRPEVRADLRRLLAVGVLGITGYNLPATIALRHVPAGTAGLLIATEPVWIAVIASAQRRNPPHGRVLAGLCLSGAGAVGLVTDRAQALPSNLSASFLTGAGLILFGAFMWGAYTVAMRPLTHRHGPLASSALTCVLGSLPMIALLPVAAPAAGSITPERALVLAGLAAGSTVAATVLFIHGVSELGPERAGVFLNVVPVISVAAAAAFLGEPVGTVTLVAGAAVIAGVMLASSAPAPAPTSGEASRTGLAEPAPPSG